MVMAFSLVMGLAHEKVQLEKMIKKSMPRFIYEMIMLISFAKVLYFHEKTFGLF